MQALDGNAIAGDLYELFGVEMTTRTGICRSCGAAAMLGELRVYTRAPGAVARCPNCGNVVFVLVDARGARRINLDGLELVEGLEPEGDGR
jgi:ribosomal protein S27AE